MDPCRLRALEALVTTIAKNPNALLPQRTEQQKAMNVPQHLIYLYAMVCHGGQGPPYTQEQASLFEHLQQLYGTQGQCFGLSPSMRPSADDAERIQQDVLAAMTAEELIFEAEKEEVEACHKSKKQPRRVLPRSSNNQQKPSKTTVNVEGKDTNLSENKTDPVLPPKTESICADDAWVEVGKKSKSKTAHTRAFVDAVDRIQQEKAESSVRQEPPKLVSHANDNPSSKAMTEEVPAGVQNCKPKHLPMLDSGPNVQAIDNDVVQRLQNRILELELALAKCNQQRMDEQQKQDEQLQALQLRLYISETRLKTYEDALADHVQAVAANVAGASPDRPHRAIEGSPGKRPWISSKQALKS